jgi:hypothetical protein
MVFEPKSKRAFAGKDYRITDSFFEEYTRKTLIALYRLCYEKGLVKFVAATASKQTTLHLACHPPSNASLSSMLKGA